MTYDLMMTLTLYKGQLKVKYHFYSKKHPNFNPTFGNMPTRSKIMESSIKSSR